MSTMIPQKQSKRGRIAVLTSSSIPTLSISSRYVRVRTSADATASAQFGRQRLPHVRACAHGSRSRHRRQLAELLAQRFHIPPPPLERLQSRPRQPQNPQLAPRVLAHTRFRRRATSSRGRCRCALHKQRGEERLRKTVLVRLEQRKVTRGGTRRGAARR